MLNNRFCEMFDFFYKQTMFNHNCSNLFVVIEHADEEQRHAFLAELELMKSIAPHPNVVGLVACCSKTSELIASPVASPGLFVCSFPCSFCRSVSVH